MEAGRLLRCASIAVALTIGLVGCGGSGTPAGTTQNAAQSARMQVAVRALNTIAQQLSQAGYVPRQATDQPDVAALRVTMKSGGSVYVVGSDGTRAWKAQAKLTLKQAANSQGRNVASIAGPATYIASSGTRIANGKRALSDKQLKEFRRIVKLGAGRK